jgi:tetratricopeptide (TPR) repeat protein
MFFAVHPLMVESVTNIVGRSDLLTVTFILGAVLVFLRGRSVRSGLRPFFMAAAAVLTLLGNLSKESALVVLGIVPLYDLCFSSTEAWWKRFRWLDYLWLVVPVSLVWLYRAYLYWGTPAASISFMDNPIADAGLMSGALTAVSVLGRYLLWILFPRELSVDYSYNQIKLIDWPPASGTDGLALLWALVLIGFSVWGLARLNRWPRFWFGYFLFLGALFPASNIIKPTASIAGERFLYFPMAGFIVAMLAVVSVLAVIWSPAGKTFRFWKIAFTALAAVWLTALACRTAIRNEDWKSNLTLFRSAVTVAPDSVRNNAVYAAMLYQQALEAGTLNQDLDDIIYYGERAMDLMSELEPRLWSGMVPIELSAYWMEKAKRLKPESPARKEALERAEFLADRVLAAWAEFPNEFSSNVRGMAGRRAVPSLELQAKAGMRKAQAAYLQNRYDTALQALELSAQYHPLDHDLYRYRAETLQQLQRYPEAAVALTQSIILGNAQSRRGDWDLMEEIFKQINVDADPVLEVGQRRGLDIRLPEVKALLRAAGGDLYHRIQSGPDPEQAEAFRRQVEAQFGIPISP